MVRDFKPFSMVLEAGGYEFFQTGSRAICEKPPAESDDDWVVFAKSDDNVFKHIMEAFGFVQDVWEEDTSLYEDAMDRTPIASWRRDKINVIVTPSRRFFDLTKRATDIAKALHIKTRAERVALFHAVRALDVEVASDWPAPPETIEEIRF